LHRRLACEPDARQPHHREKYKGLSEEEAIRQASAVNFNGYTLPDGKRPFEGLLGK